MKHFWKYVGTNRRYSAVCIEDVGSLRVESMPGFPERMVIVMLSAMGNELGRMNVPEHVTALDDESDDESDDGPLPPPPAPATVPSRHFVLAPDGTWMERNSARAEAAIDWLLGQWTMVWENEKWRQGTVLH